MISPTKNLLLLGTDLDLGGTPTVIRELAIRLRSSASSRNPSENSRRAQDEKARSALNVTVACLKPAGPVAAQIQAAGIEVISLEMTNLMSVPRAIRTLRELIVSRSIDTVLSFLVHANALASFASQKLELIRWIQSIQTVQPSPAWHWWLQRHVQSHANVVLAPSSAVVQVAMKRCDVPVERIAVIPNAIDDSTIAALPIFQSKPIRVGFLGRLDAVKNVPWFISTLEQLNHPDVVGHIFGDGPQRLALRRQIDGSPLRNRIRLRGPVSNPDAAFRDMDILLFPSTGEGFGLVLIEALARGIPVVAIDAGGVRDVIRDGIDGLLVPESQNPVAGLAEAIARLIDEPALRAVLIESGLARVRDCFTWSSVLSRYEKLLLIPPA